MKTAGLRLLLIVAALAAWELLPRIPGMAAHLPIFDPSLHKLCPHRLARSALAGIVCPFRPSSVH